MTEIRTFKNYDELKATHQKEVNQFPLGFAFNEKQYQEMMEKWGLKGDHSDDDKITYFPNRYNPLGFIRIQDIPAWNELSNRHEEEEKLFKKNKKKLIQMLASEMANHEYCITCDLTETLEACGYTIDDYKKDSYLKDCVKAAKKKYIQECSY